MYLTIDFGNTASKYALFTEEGILHSHGLYEDLSAFKAWDLKGCIFSTVRKEIPWLTGLDCPVHLFSSSMNLPINMGYNTPETLGTDRLAGVLGAKFLLTQWNSEIASLVIDAGTCITYDWLTDLGEYLGGSISPGLHMRYLALHQQTGRLPLVSHEVFENNVGKSTNESILCGVQQGVWGESHRQIAHFLEKYPNGAVFLTGGDALFLAEQQKTRIFVEPLLIHYGLLHALRYHETH